MNRKALDEATIDTKRLDWLSSMDLFWRRGYLFSARERKRKDKRHFRQAIDAAMAAEKKGGKR